MINFDELSLIEKKKLIDYSTELSLAERIKFKGVRDKILAELDEAGYNISEPMWRTIQRLCYNNKHYEILIDYLFSKGTKSVSDDHRIGEIYILTADICSTLIRKYVGVSNIPDDLLHFTFSTFLYYKIYGRYVMTALNRISTSRSLSLITNESINEDNPIIEVYRVALKKPPRIMEKQLCLLFKTLNENPTGLATVISDVIHEYCTRIDREESERIRKDRPSYIGLTPEGIPVKSWAIPKSRNSESEKKSGFDKSRPVFEHSCAIVNGTINEKFLDAVIDEAVALKVEDVDWDMNKTVSFDIPAKYKFALMNEFTTFKSCTILTMNSEKFLIQEDGTTDIFLLYMENETDLKGISLGDVSPYKKKRIEFGDLDVDSEYECCMKEDDK